MPRVTTSSETRYYVTVANQLYADSHMLLDALESFERYWKHDYIWEQVQLFSGTELLATAQHGAVTYTTQKHWDIVA